MSNAQRDENHISTMIALSNADGETILPLYADVTDNGLIVSDDLGGADAGGTNAGKDENHVSTLMAVSAVDGVTPVPLYVNAADNALLVRLL